MMDPGQVNKKQRDASRQEAKSESNKEVATIAKRSASDLEGDVKLEAKRRKRTVDVESKDEAEDDSSTTTSEAEEVTTIAYVYKDCSHITPSPAMASPPRNKSQENIPIRLVPSEAMEQIADCLSWYFLIRSVQSLLQ
jgi:hypothetical protein